MCLRSKKRFLNKSLKALSKLAAAVAAVTSGAISFTTAWSFADDSAVDYKFPVTLCVFKVARVKDVGGKPHVKAEDFTSEFAYRVENIQSLNTRDHTGRLVHVYTGDFSGQYEIPDSNYRIRFEGSIQQGGSQLGAQPVDEMKLHSYLEKRDPKTGGFVMQGQNTSEVQTSEQVDGSVWENVYSYSKNDTEFSSVMNTDKDPEKSNGKINPTKLLDALRDGKIDMGEVASAGPVCGLLDVKTAKKITIHREQFKDIYDRISDPATPASSMKPTLNPLVQAKPVEKEVNTLSNKPTDAEEAAERAEQERLANGEDPTGKPGVAVPDELQEMVNQNRLADSEASRYAQESAAAQGEAPQGVFSIPPTVAWPQVDSANTNGNAAVTPAANVPTLTPSLAPTNTPYGSPEESPTADGTPVAAAAPLNHGNNVNGAMGVAF